MTRSEPPVSSSLHAGSAPPPVPDYPLPLLVVMTIITTWLWAVMSLVTHTGTLVNVEEGAGITPGW